MLDICAISLSVFTNRQPAHLYIRFSVVTALLFEEQTAREVDVPIGGMGEGVKRATETEFSEKLISKL